MNWSTYKISSEKTAKRLLVDRVSRTLEKERIIKARAVITFGQLKEKGFDTWSLTVKTQSTNTNRSIIDSVMPQMIPDDILLSVTSPLYIQDRWNKFAREFQSVHTG